MSLSSRKALEAAAAAAAEEEEEYRESAWNLDFLRTKKGMLLVAQVICSIVGGIVNFYHGGLGRGLFNFAFWSTTMLSALVMAIYLGRIDATINPTTLWRMEMFYVVTWIVLYAIGCALSFVQFGMSAIFAYVILLSYVMDLVFRYYEYRTKSPPDFKAKNPLESAFDPPQQKFGYA